MHGRASAIVFVTGLAVVQAGSLVSARQRAARRAAAAPAVPRAAIFRAIMAAEDARISLPDSVHAPALEALRATMAEDVRMLVELTRSNDPDVQIRAIRALGRYERRDVIGSLLPFIGAVSPGDAAGQARLAEAATAIAQAFQGAALPGDASGQQVQVFFDLLSQVGESNKRALGPISRSIGRLPYVRPDQAEAADRFLAAALERADPDLELRDAFRDTVRAVESRARNTGKLAPLSDDLVSWLRRIASRSRKTQDRPTREIAMEALIVAGGMDADSLAAAAGDADSDDVRRLAAMALGTAGSPIEAPRRTELLTTLLADNSARVRLEALRAWSRQEAAASGCAPILAAAGDGMSGVALEAIDLLADACRDDEDVTNWLTTEVRSPPAAAGAWHRESHALVALAKRAPDRAAIPLAAHLAHPAWQVRLYAARAAAILADAQALTRLASDQEANVREAALPPLRRLKGADADPVFVAALGDKDYQLVLTAADALKGAVVTEPLVRALGDALRRVTADKKDTSRDVRLALLERLRELGTAGQAGVLVPLLDDFDITIALAAESILEQWTGQPFDVAPQPLPRPALPLPAEIEEELTSPGRITLGSGSVLHFRLMPDSAPLTCTRFFRLVKAGYYNRLSFHRVVQNFVVQGGSPGANEYAGDAAYLRDEITRAAHLRGALGLSTRGRDTGDAQFFISLVANPRLDFQYTVFGFIDSKDFPLLDQIAEGETIVSIAFGKPAVK